jgi:hypothetical protein
MSDDDVPLRVFEGAYAEVLFLKSLMESVGIEASLSNTGYRGGPPCLICVRRADVERALEVVNDFRKNGKRTDPW